MPGLLLLGTAEIAFAQTTGTIPSQIGAAPRSNRGAPTREMDIRAAVDASYDSNAFGLGDAQVLRGRSKDDFRITPSLLLNIFIPVGQQSFFLGGRVGYDFYTQNSRLSRERIGLNGGANLRLLGNCSVSPNANYFRQRSNAGDVFVVSTVPVTGRVNTEEQASIGADVSCAGAIGLSPTFSYHHNRIRNSSSFFKLNDSNQDSFEGSIGYQRPSLGRIAIYGSYFEGEYLRRNILGLPSTIPGIPLDGVQSYSVGGRFERDIGSRISGAVSLGYSWVDPKSLFSSKFRGSTYSANLNVRPSDNMSVDLQVSRAANLSNTVFATYAVTQVYALNGTYRLNRKMGVNFGSSFQKRNYHQNAEAVGNGATLRDDKFIRAYTGVVYDLNRRLRLNGLVSQQRRKSNNPLFNYNNTTVSMGVSFALGR